MKDIADAALDLADRRGASYCDVRLQRRRNEYITTREEKLEDIASNESFGAGIRVLVEGTWGFAASNQVTRREIEALTEQAVASARANRRLQREPVELGRVPSFRDRWQSPVEQDPFLTPLSTKVDLLLDINRAALQAGANFVKSHLFSVLEEKHFFSSVGSDILQRIIRLWPAFEVTAVDRVSGEFKTRSSLIPPLEIGFEQTRTWDLVAEAAQAAEEARQMLTARPVEPGRRDLILHDSNLWLVLHESVAHATELDRVLGYEANYAGTSFATLDKLGSFRYGSPIVNIFADRTQPTALATVAYDDEGVKSSRWDIVRDGTLVDYQTTREQIAWPAYQQAREQAGLPRPDQSHACSYADSFDSVQFQRIPNVSLAPGKIPLSLEELIADTQDAILIYGDGSWSIDQQRYNFQFGGQTFWEIKDGRIVGMLRDVAYQSNTQDFWSSCDAICSEEHYRLGGSFFCGKGQPTQLAATSHGCAPARFRNINILNTAR